MNLERAAKLILMLSSDNDGEVLNAARMLSKMGIHEIASMVRGAVGAAIRPGQYATYGWDDAGSNNWFRDWQRDARQARKQAKDDAIEAKIDQVVKAFLDTFPELQVDDLDRKSIGRFVKKLDMDFVLSAIKIAAERVAPEAAFRYWCGICWHEVRSRQEAA